MKNIERFKLIHPHIVLLIHGRILCIIKIACDIIMFNKIQDWSETFVVVGYIGFLALSLLLWYNVGDQIWGTLAFTKTSVVFFGLFLPIVKLKYDDISFIDIREFKEGNPMHGALNTVDAYKFVLLSPNPLPQKRIDKIKSSRRKKIIKFAVNYKLCCALMEKLPKEKTKSIDYQLFLYKKAKRR